jgi:hypothetical protein
VGEHDGGPRTKNGLASEGRAGSGEGEVGDYGNSTSVDCLMTCVEGVPPELILNGEEVGAAVRQRGG